MSSSSRWTTGRKPMSAMRSASSTTTISTASRRTSRRSIRSVSRPGHATSTSTPRRSAFSWAPKPAPPYTAATRSLRWRPSHSSSPHTCAASSRVGTSTRPVGRLGAARPTRRTSGMPKAMVLPDPVGARPQRSRPAQPSARVRVWMAKGARIPRAFRVETSSGGTPRSAKVVVMLIANSGVRDGQVSRRVYEDPRR